MKIPPFLVVYIVSCAIWIYYDSKNHDITGRWALASLFFHPFVVPYYLIKTRPKGASKPIGLWILGYVVFASIWGFYRGFVESYEDEFKKIEAVEKEFIAKLHTNQENNAVFKQALDEVMNLQDLDTIPAINEAIALIEKTDRLLRDLNKDMIQIEAYTEVNEADLKISNPTEVIIIKELYGDKYRVYRKALKNFLDAYKTMVIFTRDNYDEIISEDESKLLTLEDLFTKYVSAGEAQNKAWLEYLQFAKTFKKENPNIAKYLKQ